MGLGKKETARLPPAQSSTKPQFLSCPRILTSHQVKGNRPESPTGNNRYRERRDNAKMNTDMIFLNSKKNNNSKNKSQEQREKRIKTKQNTDKKKKRVRTKKQENTDKQHINKNMIYQKEIAKDTQSEKDGRSHQKTNRFSFCFKCAVSRRRRGSRRNKQPPPVPVRLTVWHPKKIFGGVNPSLCKHGQPPYSDKRTGKTPRQCFSTSFPHKKFSCTLHCCSPITAHYALLQPFRDRRALK